MKKILIIVSIFLSASKLFAQIDSLPSIKPGWANLDFTIPESPAFKILGTDPDNILKPTSVRKAAFSIGNYFVTNGPIIPKNLSVEIAPLLLNSKTSLFQYNNHKFWYRMRFSIGTNTAQNGSYSVAEGLRFSLLDKTDLRTNSAFNSYLQKTLEKGSHEDIQLQRKAIEYYITKHPSQKLDEELLFGNLETDSSFRKEIDSIKTYFIADKSIDAQAISEMRDKYRDSLWNAPIIELGIATLQSSSDSLVKNLKFSQVAVWLSAGFPLGSKGQVLIGAKGGIIDSSGWKGTTSAGVRFYYGSNNIKGFLQGEYDYKDKINSGVASLGCQFNILNGLWGQFSINLVVDGKGKVSYQPGFNIGLGTPEKKK